MATVMKRQWTHNGVTKTAWIVRYLDDTGAKRQKTFEKKKEADAYRDQVKAEITAGTHVAKAATITVRELCNHFLKAAEDRVRDGRIGRNRLHVLTTASNRSIIAGLGPKLVSQLTALDVEDWYRWMIRTGGLLPATAKERVQMLKQMIDHAIRYRWAKVNVTVEALKELRGVRKQKIRTFSIEDVQQLLRSLARRRPHQQARTHAMNVCFVNIAAFCGLRYGEITGLTLQHVDLRKRIIRVRHSLTKFDELKSPKTNAGNRDVPIPAHVAAMLQAWIERYALPEARGLIFRTKTGGHINASTWTSQDWNGVLKAAGLLDGEKRLHFHALRHFCASWMLETGWSVTEVARYLGHASFDVTLSTYSHVVVGAERRHAMIEKTVEAALPGVLLPLAPAMMDATETQRL